MSLTKKRLTELMMEARERYPIGTKFIPSHQTGFPVFVNNHEPTDDGIVINSTHTHINLGISKYKSATVALIKHGERKVKWAKITTD